MLARLNKAWRIAATGVFFALLFGGGAVLALTAFPLVRLVTRDEKRRRDRCQLLIHSMFRLYVWLLQALRLLDMKIVNGERLGAAGGRIIVANHPSLLDIVMIMGLVRHAQCIVKKELWESRTLGKLVRAAGYIRNDLEPDAMIAACRASLAAGDSLVIFPEGTRSTPGAPLAFQRGFANIAILLEAEMQLVVITCTPPTLIKGEKWWVVPIHKPLFVVEAAGLIGARTWADREHRSIASRQLTRHLENYFTVRLNDG